MPTTCLVGLSLSISLYLSFSLSLSLLFFLSLSLYHSLSPPLSPPFSLFISLFIPLFISQGPRFPASLWRARGESHRGDHASTTEQKRRRSREGKGERHTQRYVWKVRFTSASGLEERSLRRRRASLLGQSTLQMSLMTPFDCTKHCRAPYLWLRSLALVEPVHRTEHAKNTHFSITDFQSPTRSFRRAENVQPLVVISSHCTRANEVDTRYPVG